MAWVLDLDGVLWLADQPIDGSAEAVARLRAAGERVVFLTNNSSATVQEYLAKLERAGVGAEAADLVTSAMAAASLVEPGQRVLACAGAGVHEAVRERGAEVVDAGEVPTGDGGPVDGFDAVVVGWHRTFDFGRLHAACRGVWGGARLIATNDDPTYPTPTGPLPGGGSLVAAVATATGCAPRIAGKPHEPVAALLRARVGELVLMVGDRDATDGAIARRLGIPFALVLSGSTAVDAVPSDPAPDHVAPDLAALVDDLLGA